MRLSTEDILNYSINFEKLAGALEPPPDMIKPILDFALHSYASKAWAEALDSENEYSNSIINYLKQFTSGPNNQPSFTQKFKLDVSNWQYSKRNLTKFFYVTVIIDFLGGSSYGSWNETGILQLHIPITINNIDQVIQMMTRVYSTVIHELTHLSQTLINKSIEQGNMGGLPKKKVLDKDYAPSGKSYLDESKQEHSLRSIEFHPRLQEAILIFNTEIQNFIVYLKSNKISLDRAYFKELFKKFVGIKVPPKKPIGDYIENVKSPYYIKIMLKREPLKWKIFVKYLMNRFSRFF